MTGQIPDDLEMTIYIALKTVTRAARLDLAARLPHQSDRGAPSVARQLVVQFRLSNLTIIKSKPISSHWTIFDDSNYARKQEKDGKP